MTPNYNIKELHNVWLVNKYGDVLVKNIKCNSKPIHIRDTTLVRKSASTLVKAIESQWNILCTLRELDEIYSFKFISEYGLETQAKVYILHTQMHPRLQFRISNHYDGVFINYKDLDDTFSKYEQSEDFKESYYSMLAEVDKEYGLSMKDYLKINQPQSPAV